MNNWQSKRIGIIGPGLIGGSFALALKKAGLQTLVWGCSPDQSEMALAKEMAIVDKVAKDLSELVQEVEVIFIASPVMAIEQIFKEIYPYLKDHHIITDACSTKCFVIDKALLILKERSPQFVPAHPIAGSEKNGPLSADADLFRHKQVVITPLPNQHTLSLKLVEALWLACGASLRMMEPATHDQIYAKLSHLPHLLSAAYLNALTKHDEIDWGKAGTGFKDFTRIAAGPEQVWRDIFITNAPTILNELEAFEASIKEVKALVAAADIEKLDEWLKNARSQAMTSRISHIKV
ncbi:prephenate dehydrogenase [Basilea psittacipulmonis]|uniref:Prephenate/arogenate dehydrogenase domain-containing protein n=1 Tax=Basilea psittacipulmonis DSM 24701 TaxID=1072685 RepID=A0A077DFH7_9BURK|nr:prephenate dehydrogenase/arogenate dehydrogenase family protein [Basilea psittacipulmonis]AIL32916.1 hypothetical protein IX83_05940 [Basilea psittacipulmonis DSM 24701]